MLWDTHMHTHFSTDSQAKPEEMIQASIRAGVDGICFTDHLDLDYNASQTEFNLDIPGYFQEMQRIQQHYSGNFPVLAGIEIGLQPHLADRLPQLIESHPFDFVIGSSHVVHGQDPYFPEYYLEKTEMEAYREYFESILENLAVFDCFDVYGHLDYVVRYGPTKNENYTYEQFSDVLEEILRILVEKGKGLELNTGGFRYGLGHPNPTEPILKRYRELGGEIVTVGADGHRPEHVAFDFAKVPEILKQAGFEYYTVFQGRKPVFYRL
ncbi:MAG: histidinol-phosphatase HisJ family protein [Lachnospiraceae bacterium]|nr:histidinol-phosphatase HisJ family protein [Lachnospiraceae bacterium]